MTSLNYSLSVKSRADHLFSVTLTIPVLDSDSLTLSLPAWIPGSYMIRDFARNIVTLEAMSSEGEPIKVEKTDKQHWSLQSQGKEVIVRYDIYAFDLSVRSAFLSDEYGFCNGTSVFLNVVELAEIPCNLDIDIPTECRQWILETTLPKRPAGKGKYRCANYNELIDHPIFMGEAVCESFHVEGVEFVMLFSGTTPINTQRICEDMEPVCRHHLSLFGGPPPISRYVFMTLLSSSGFGGLEHRSSTALLYPRFDLPLENEGGSRTEQYITFLSLCCHELFHTWHVKRLRPKVLLNPDLSSEVYTNQLWIYEGFTSFYDDLALARVGLISPEKYLEIVAQNLTRLQRNIGRFKQSAAESSFDAWTRFYKQDASAPNHIVSYYTKGGIIAMGLDLLLRKESAGQITLDTLMQHLWENYGRSEIGTPDDVIEKVCRETLNIDVSQYLNDVVYGTQDVPLDNWLEEIGVRLHTRPNNGMADKGGTPPAAACQKHPLGAAIKNAETGVTIQVIFEGQAASQAGLQVGDRIIAANGWLVTDVLLQRLLNQTKEKVLPVSVLRDGRLFEVNLPVLQESHDACYFTIENNDKLKAWLGINQHY